ncbi:MAG: DUF3392 family protein [Fibrobacter sp.]|nr:DUF3392 family protein [Fibrobacter sp.]
MQPYIHQFANFLRVHMDSISVGLVATVLMIYGAYINNYFKKITRSIPYLGRFALFVVLCSAGYAFLSSQLVRLLKMFLQNQADLPLIGLVGGAFITLAFLARSGKDI